MTREDVALTLYSMGRVLMETAEQLAKTAAQEPAASEAKAAITGKTETPALDSEKAEPPKKPSAQEEKPIALEDVRAVLSDISRSGHTAEMKTLLAKHGAKKLSDVSPSDYADLIAEAKEVKNAGSSL